MHTEQTPVSLQNPAQSTLGAELFSSFASSPYLSNKHTSYFDAYASLLQSYRGQAITFVEIGVFSGGSLFMWRDFFGPQARIIGIEFNPNAVMWREHGFEIHIGSQSDPEFWKAFFKNVGNVDVILDDGGHTYEQQIKTASWCIPHIKDGGCLIVEDTHTSYMKAFGYPSRFTFTEWVKSLIDKINSRSSLVKPTDNTLKNIVSSLEVFESMVAFKINRAMCKRSLPIGNLGKNINSEDYRFKEYEPTKFLPETVRQSRLGKKIIASISKKASRFNLKKLRTFF
jgi:hypothetical protein